MIASVKPVVNVEMFRFTHESREHQDRFKSQLRALRSLPFVMGGRAIVGSDTVTTPLERSRGFHVVFVSYHTSLAALHAFEAHQEYRRTIREIYIPWGEERLKFSSEVQQSDLALMKHSAFPPITLPRDVRSLVHIVCFKFRPEVSLGHINQFKEQIRALGQLACVKEGQLICSGPPSNLENHQGYHLCLISYHVGLDDLAAYQASQEHHDVTSRLMFPYKEELTRFDFLVSEQDERLCTLAG